MLSPRPLLGPHFNHGSRNADLAARRFQGWNEAPRQPIPDGTFGNSEEVGDFAHGEQWRPLLQSCLGSKLCSHDEGSRLDMARHLVDV